jgi:hypothetical protein|tara:strand:+ start:447 stop:1094 length:648 start_codon:yes stop_codon:yes gene_type:complete
MKNTNKKSNKSFDKTQANIISNAIIRNAKDINKSELNTSSLILIDICKLASHCSTYEFKAKGHTSYIKKELLRNENLYGSKSKTKSRINRLFECANSPVMRSIYGINQNEKQIKTTLDKLNLECQEDILNYKKLYTLDKHDNLIEKPSVEKPSVEQSNDKSKITDTEFLDNQLVAIKERDITDTDVLSKHINKLIAHMRILKEHGEVDTKKQLAK